MTGDEKKKRDPIFSACFVIFILAAVGVIGVYIDEHYIAEDHTKVAYGDTIHVSYVGTFYDYDGSANAVEFDSGSDLDFEVATGSDVLAPFWQACIGHEVGDTFRVKVTGPEGYVAGSTVKTIGTTGNTMAITQKMTEYQFDQLYGDYDLSNSASTVIETVYGWNAIATLSSDSHEVTMTYQVAVGGEYTFKMDEDSDVTVTYVVTGVNQDGTFTYDLAVAGTTVVDESTGEIQMVELDMGNEVWQITNIKDGQITYKTCADTYNQDLYFVITITEIE